MKSLLNVKSNIFDSYRVGDNATYDNFFQPDFKLAVNVVVVGVVGDVAVAGVRHIYSRKSSRFIDQFHFDLRPVIESKHR